MRFSIFYVFILLNYTYQNIESKKVSKRFTIMNLMAAKEFGGRVISMTLGIMSMVSENRQQSDIVEKLDDLESKINQLENQQSQTNTLLQTILHEIRKSPYSDSIKDSEREIEQCFDSFKAYVVSPRSKQAIDNLKKCYEKMAYVKEIAKIASGRAVGLSQGNLFEISIREQGHCNGTQLTFLQRRLKRLLMNGCSAVVAAEELLYRNTSTHYQTDCRIEFEKIDEYDKKLFAKCSQEHCDVVLANIDSILKNIHSSSEALSALSYQFPWFYFAVIEVVHCKKDCFQENLKSRTPRPFPFNLHTFHGKDKTFLIVYRDVKYSAAKTGEESGFDLPRDCMVHKDFQNNLGLQKHDHRVSQTITLSIRTSQSENSYARICKGTIATAKCITSSATSLTHCFYRKIPFYATLIAILIYTSIFLL